jgi:hypothetical protein
MASVLANPGGKCMCGCGARTPMAPRTQSALGWAKGKPKRFIRGHHLRGNTHAACKRSHNFTFGYYFNKALGRWYINCRDGVKVAYYRAVMEAHIGRELRPGEHVHHINGDSTDDRIENLELLSATEHCRKHALENGLGRNHG